MANIACLIILIYNVQRWKTKRADLEMICLYLQGWAKLDELEVHIAKPQLCENLNKLGPRESSTSLNAVRLPKRSTNQTHLNVFPCQATWARRFRARTPMPKILCQTLLRVSSPRVELLRFLASENSASASIVTLAVIAFSSKPCVHVGERSSPSIKLAKTLRRCQALELVR